MTVNTTATHVLPDTRTQPVPDRQHLNAGTQPRPSCSAADAVRAYLRLQLLELTSLEPLARRDEPDAAHQMRVAARRLRGALHTFGEVIPRSATAHAAEELKWLGGLLGAARDDEVLPARLGADLRSTPVEQVIGPVQARVRGHFAPRRAAARAELVAELDSPRYVALLAELDRLAMDPPLGPRAADPARDVLPAAVGRDWRQARRRMRRAWRAPDGKPRDVALHRARKSARRARYAAEAAVPVAGKPARRFARQMKKVQSVLGEHQDSVLAREAARELGIGAHLAGENAFSYGLLRQREVDEARRLRDQARRVWRRASRRKYRRWMK
jgi:CHAD domain-containing protein